MPGAAALQRTGLSLFLCTTEPAVAYTVLEMLKTDILNVISEYMEIEEDDLDIKLTHIGEKTERFLYCLRIYL